MKKSICLILMAAGVIFRAAAQETEEVRQEAEISVEEATARDALLVWAKKNTQGYADVNVTNFTTSWSNALAFCALINKFRPNILDYNSLDKSDAMTNAKKAFDACRELIFRIMNILPKSGKVQRTDTCPVQTAVPAYSVFRELCLY